MVNLSTYVNNSIDNVNESVWIAHIFRYVGTILLSTVIPYLISLGVKIVSLKLDIWVQNFIKKYPQHKDAILLLSKVLKEDLDKCKKSKELIINSEHQKPSSYYKLNEYKDEILNNIQSEEDKKKIEELFKLIDSDNFKEEIDEF